MCCAFGSDDRTTFRGSTAIGSQAGQTAAQIGAGLVAQWTKRGSTYAAVSYLTNLGGEHRRTIIRHAGVRWTW
ncbi:transporter [Burkholderia multivorans]|uniref:autotransporter outer membrane beta-barrel domain-containing protein n=1 Tax=Burkholderia multivorans TaxID=87883 RepID=UPI000D007DB7|nr:autotransporter outer membrane beta-barrel domain-containing protein [Burkholderia multivorans]PRF30554.1 transporter [Burkholderia multivorans]